MNRTKKTSVASGKVRTATGQPGGKAAFGKGLATKKAWMPYIVGILFAAVVYIALVVDMSDLLFRAQELSLFLCTDVFFHQQMAVPGGFSVWVAAYLTQFFYYPALGAAVWVLLWLVNYALSVRVFRLPNRWLLLALIAPLCMMAIGTSVGYWLFYQKTVGYFFIAPVAFLGMLLMLWAYRACPTKLRWVAIPVLLAGGFPLFGFYALAGGLLMILFALRDERNMRMKIAQAVWAALWIGLVPIGSYYVYTQQSWDYCYVPLLPFYSIDFSLDPKIGVPYILLFLAPLLMFLASGGKSASAEEEGLKKQSKIGGRKVGRWLENGYICSTIQVALLAAFFVFARSFWFDDPNFRAELYMNRAAEEQRWEDIVARAHLEPQEPTRLMVLYRNLALLRLGRGGDEMFHFPDGGASHKAAFDVRMMQVGGKMIYFHYAKLNFCYRWCLEDAVEYGLKIDYLRYMAKCALFSGEKELARKYLRILKKTLFYADWAEYWEDMLDHPEKLQELQEYKDIMALYDYSNVLDADQNLAEIYLINVFSHGWSPKPLFQEASMMCTLVMKDIPLFWPRFFGYISTHQRVPVHYQEAALLYAYLERQVDASKLPIDDEVRQRFARFIQMPQRYQGMTEEQMKPYYYAEFGDTFWYFYFLVRDVRTN